MFNTVLTCSVFPEAWKMSKIRSVPKILNPGELRDYRRISVLPARCRRLWKLSCVTKWISYSVLTNLFFALVTARPRSFLRLPMTYCVIVTGDWWRFFSCWISPRRLTMFGILYCWRNFHCTLSSGVLRCIWLVFINDIVAQIDFCRFHMYADDVQHYLSDDLCSLDDCIYPMNADLDRLYIWAAENGLC
jgi:hypothetical protein